MMPDEDDHGRSLEAKVKDKEGEIEVTLDHERSKLSYHGRVKREAGADNEEEEGVRYVVAVLDRASNTAEILPARSGLAVRMHHRVKGFVPVQPEDHSSVNRGTYVREFASHREHKARFCCVCAVVSDCFFQGKFVCFCFCFAISFVFVCAVHRGCAACLVLVEFCGNLILTSGGSECRVFSVARACLTSTSSGSKSTRRPTLRPTCSRWATR
jgi:hypothetical protein